VFFPETFVVMSILDVALLGVKFIDKLPSVTHEPLKLKTFDSVT
jgi:hypothetical protein